ncbi:ROK family protein [Shewanella fidelis]|uniref:ROK family protein n=1 Tax=Shewanella fidelis TaxID=173509 RepID=UPI00048AED8E|nr:ROK family protein [Shewanella fidelis]
MQTLTIDISGSKALFEITTQGRVEQYKIAITDAFNINNLNSQIADLEQDYGLEDYGLGIAVPGLVQSQQLVSCQSLPGLKGLSADDLYTGAKQVIIANDSDAGLHALMGSKQECELLVMCDMGIGMSIAINGVPFTGASATAGELGHCRIMTEFGEFSLEQLASGAAIKRRNWTRSDDIARAGSYIGQSLAWVVNLFNPSQIYLAGSLMNNPHYYQACVAAIKEMALPIPVAKVKINRVDAYETVVCRGLKAMLSK